jgi:excisionase family DNA binding protein
MPKGLNHKLSSGRKRPLSRVKADSVAAGMTSEVAELPPTISVEHAAKLLGLSRSAAYRAAATGQLPTISFGRRLLVPTSRLLEMLGLPVEERP